ncbi:DUF4329 domain-containing protein [Niastella koreensis]|uniref:DUF4329 domain-containing protein n=1 Tax=Niastella koreensis TaxID=354356 RepID=UPI001A996F58|nr:DUF4329 domain-containing protein [Niastella koreensis]
MVKHFVIQPRPNNPIRFIDPDGMAAGPGDHFQSVEEAAKDFGQTYNGSSIKSGTESITVIYIAQDPKTQEIYYSYFEPQTQDEAAGATFNIVLPDYVAGFVAIIHTHGKYLAELGKGNEIILSKQDYYEGI